MRSVLIFRWGPPHVGREPDGMRFAAECEAMFRTMLDDGVIERFEWITSVTAEEDDMMVLWGDGAMLREWIATDRAAHVVAEGRYLMRDFRWDLGLASDKATEVYGAWGAMLMEHATA